ncbi:MAG: OmpA family protein [Reyranella sp.]|uniref:OmpA family protein n=1 Tax=Reyranella sp. TaxID=1929291 RepID=UPI001AC77A22|nr:OmpA family protein [Reyranella sp.]MBN9088541.1 OmpA family protein [Reyranella sp.]
MYKPLLATACAALLLAACGDRTQAVVAAASPQTQQPARNFMLFFANDRATLSPDSEAIVREAAAAAKANPAARVTVAGHADTTGNSAYNQALSQRRAASVRDELVKNGLNPASIAVVGRGEDALLVSTKDGMHEPKNRRVEIIVR